MKGVEPIPKPEERIDGNIRRALCFHSWRWYRLNRYPRSECLRCAANVAGWRRPKAA